MTLLAQSEHRDAQVVLLYLYKTNTKTLPLAFLSLFPSSFFFICMQKVYTQA